MCAQERPSAYGRKAEDNFRSLFSPATQGSNSGQQGWQQAFGGGGGDGIYMLCAGMHACLSMCLGQRSMLEIFLYQSPGFFLCFSVLFLFLSHGLSLNLELTDQLDCLLSP